MSDPTQASTIRSTRQGGLRIPFDNTYARLPDVFQVRCDPDAAPNPELVRVNRPLAEELGLGLNGVDDSALAAAFSGQAPPQGAEPLAMAYAGHQFGNFVPSLGDGRALLLGEVIDRNGIRRDIQLKGSGRTPFSRQGDGLAPLGPVLREYLVSEAMHALGVPTTRALAAVTTGGHVMRESVLPAAVMTRVAAGHVRVGTFQYYAARGDAASVRRLADYVIDRHYPDARRADNPYLALLGSVCERQASLVARWMQFGFIHGVMNTDNMAVSGETLDYGPCAFMDTYHPQTTFSFIDQMGRYAFGNQPGIAQWNLTRLAEALLPLLADDESIAIDRARDVLEAFMDQHEALWLSGMRAKLGLYSKGEADHELIDHLLAVMADNRVDFTGFFRNLCTAVAPESDDEPARRLFDNPDDWDQWAARWRERLVIESVDAAERAAAMRTVNPAVIPRTHAIEQAIRAAEDYADFGPFHELAEVLAAPFADHPGDRSYVRPPLPEERVPNTFCGT